MSKEPKSLLKILLMALLFWGIAVRAQDTGVSGTNLELYRPAIDSFGYFGVNRPEVYRAGQFNLGMSQSFATNHIFRATINRRDLDVVDRIATTNFFGAVGVSDLMTMALDVPAHFYMKGTNVDSRGEFTSRSLGDIRAGMKFRLLEEKKGGLQPGLALLFTNTFPTGNERKFLGTSHMVPAADLILGKGLKGVDLALNMGGRFPRQKNILGQDFNDQVTYGVGAKVPFGFWDKLLSFMGEIRGHFEPGDIQTTTSPIEFTLGLLKEFQNGLAIRAGGGGAWNNAIGNPRMRGILTISYNGSFIRQKSTSSPGAVTPVIEKEDRHGESEREEKIEEANEGEAEKRVQELEVQIRVLEEKHKELEKHLAETEKEMELEKKPAVQAEKEREEKIEKIEEANEGEAEKRVRELEVQIRVLEERHKELEKHLAETEIKLEEESVPQAEKEQEEKIEKIEEAKKEERVIEAEKKVAETEKVAETTIPEKEPVKPPEEPPLEEIQLVSEQDLWKSWLPGFDLSPRERSLWTTVYFSLGTSKPRPESLEWVDELAQAVCQTPQVEKVIIQGHADDVGGEVANIRLSLDRAERIKEILLSRGVSEKLVQLEAHASKYPMAPNDTEWGRRLNRRAELIVVLPKGMTLDQIKKTKMGLLLLPRQ